MSRAGGVARLAGVDAERARVLRDLLAASDWVRRTREFGRAVRGAGHEAGGLLLVGTAQDEPWHLTAHRTHFGKVVVSPIKARKSRKAGDTAAEGDTQEE